MAFDLAEYLRQQKLAPAINSPSAQGIADMQSLPDNNPTQGPTNSQPPIQQNPIQSTDVRTPDSTPDSNNPNPSANPNTSVNVGDPLPESIYKPGPLTQKYQQDIGTEPMKADFHVGKGRRIASIVAGIAGGMFGGGGLPGGLAIARKVAEDPYNKAHDAYSQRLNNEGLQSTQENTNQAAMQKYYTEIPKIALEQAQTAEANRKASAFTPTTMAETEAVNQSKLPYSDKTSYVATLKNGVTVPGLTWNSKTHGYEVMGKPYTIPQGAQIAKLGAAGERPDHSGLMQQRDAENIIAHSEQFSPSDLIAAKDFVNKQKFGVDVPTSVVNPNGSTTYEHRQNAFGKGSPKTTFDVQGNATTGTTKGISTQAPPTPPEGAVNSLAGDAKVLKQADDLEAMLKDKKFTGGLGPVAGLVTLAKFNKLGGLGMTPQQLQLATSIRNLAKDESFSQAGKSVTGRESDLVKGTIVQDNDTLASALVKLRTRAKILRGDYKFRKDALGRAGGNIPNAPDNSNARVRVQIPNMPEGSIPQSALEEFKRDHPNAKILGQ